MSDLVKEKARLQGEILLCKKLLKQNVSSIGSSKQNREQITQQVVENPLATLYLIDQLTDTFLPHDHKINQTLKGVKKGVEIVDGILAS